MRNGILTAKILCLASLIIFIFFFSSFYLANDLSSTSAYGKFYEAIAQPAISLLIAIPFVSLYLVIRYRNLPKKYIVFSFLFIALAVAILLWPPD